VTRGKRWRPGDRATAYLSIVVTRRRWSDGELKARRRRWSVGGPRQEAAMEPSASRKVATGFLGRATIEAVETAPAASYPVASQRAAIVGI